MVSKPFLLNNSAQWTIKNAQEAHLNFISSFDMYIIMYYKEHQLTLQIAKTTTKAKCKCVANFFGRNDAISGS